ncbi:acetylxylan esterase [Algoriphagus sp. NG3]|uniref:glucuronyl esterase domain-containing protein n=1 Tax=Algoriphagus sp. NG3 TaxID=3097546 RepID=UPI002A8146BA|nr:acetylxylan esterase [Algoriphagus sp. NG3]WPR77071.1 acetylxylan esterase [Algoriphagus sp. NG3]
MKKSILCALLLGLGGLTKAQNIQLDLSQYPSPVTFTNEQDHANMQQQLGIKVLRPGISGNEAAPNAANYDESKANPCPELPDILTTNDGRRVISEDMWWETRRPELVDALEREVYGKLPENIPSVKWEVKIIDREFVARTPIIAKQIIGHVDNSSYPLINVDINMILVVPANAKGPVPVLMMFGRPSFPAPAQPSGEDMEILNSSFKEMMIKNDPSIKAIFDKYPAYTPVTRLPGPNFFAPPVSGDSPTTEQLLAAGWGYLTIDPSSIQADNHAGITRGIIGLVNKGQPRSPEDWGALRAWAWGAARALDYLETDSLVDSKKVGIEGVSRYGKAALVTMAFEPRFATALIGSSGKGGTTLHRRVFGEAVESLAGGENYWMAGNYMKYGAEKSEFGRLDGCDLPVDSHDMLALCAPRPVFVSYGIPEKGDAKWLDQKGSYMAVIAAGTAYKFLGATDLGVSNDYMKEEMPPYNTDMLEGDLAWRQHDGGHTDAPNMQYFIPWANRVLGNEK